MTTKTDFISEGIRNYLEQRGKKGIFDAIDMAVSPEPEEGLERLGTTRAVLRMKQDINVTDSHEVNIIQAGGDVHYHQTTGQQAFPPIERMIKNFEIFSQIFKLCILCREPFVLIRLLFQGNLLIFLLDANYLPIKESQVDLWQKGARLGSANPNQEGMVAFEKIPPGRYNLGVKHPSTGNKEFEIVVDEPTLSEPLQRFIAGDCRIFFMPIVSFFNGEIYGYEALAREPDRDRFPVELFAEAESLRVVDKLNLACIKKALEEVQKPKFPKGKKVFLNVSPSTFELEEFKALFGDRTLPLHPWNIVFEILESPIKDIARFKEDITPLFLVGYNFAVDDQGADGTYALRLLKLRTRYVKADWQFVNHSLENNDLQVLDGYQEFATKHNGLMVIEGVTEEWGTRDLRKFYERKVTFGQGFLFGKAKPVEEIAIEIPEKGRELLKTVYKGY